MFDILSVIIPLPFGQFSMSHAAINLPGVGYIPGQPREDIGLRRFVPLTNLGLLLLGMLLFLQFPVQFIHQLVNSPLAALRFV